MLTLFFVIFIAGLAMLGAREWGMRQYEAGFNEAMTVMDAGDLIDAILDANPERDFNNYHRRMIKLNEETGELAEAYLNATSSAPTKQKTFADVREEAADAVIVAVDLALTATPDQAGLSHRQVQDEFVRMVAVKLAKWRRNKAQGKVATDQK